MRQPASLGTMLRGTSHVREVIPGELFNFNGQGVNSSMALTPVAEELLLAELLVLQGI
jgi:hypothetical protein